MSTPQTQFSVQGESALLIPKTPEEIKRGYIAGAVASAFAFGLGAFSIYQTIKHGRPIDITKLATSLVLSLGSACNCGLCIKWALTTPTLTSRVEPESAMEAGEIQKVDNLIRPLLNRINTLITDPRYQQEGTTIEAVNLEDSLAALSQQINAMASLLDGLHGRAAATEQELDEKSTQVDEQVEQLKQTFQEQVVRLDAKIAELEARVAPPVTPQARELALLSPAAPAAALSPMISGASSPAQPSPGTASADLVAALTKDIFAGLDNLKFTGSPASRGSSRPPSAPGSPSVAVASAPSSFSPSYPTGGAPRKSKPSPSALGKSNEGDN
jgi:hypothetical protein